MQNLHRDKQIRQLDELLNQTLKLISLYKKRELTIPFSLKGNLGEFIVAKELLKRFGDYKIDLRGGAFPGVDIAVDDIKIQVKTQIKHKPDRYFDFESSPTIRRSTIDDEKVHVIVLVILYLDEKFRKIAKSNIYVFNRSAFKHFSHKGCWSGKSKSDYTIYNILSVKGNPPPKKKEMIDFYNKRKYRNLFRCSKDNWGKIEELLK